MFLDAVGLIVFSLWGKSAISNSTKNRNNQKSLEVKKLVDVKGEAIHSSFVEYYGGHPELSKYGLYNIDIYSNFAGEKRL